MRKTVLVSNLLIPSTHRAVAEELIQLIAPERLLPVPSSFMVTL